nr:MAG TPA: hypothetical protein [Caudoviricetes sp.]
MIQNGTPGVCFTQKLLQCRPAEPKPTCGSSEPVPKYPAAGPRRRKEMYSMSIKFRKKPLQMRTMSV